MKILGVIGGLGPMATAFFMQMVIEMTKAQTDQEHIEMLIHSRPQIPDRTNYILGLSDKNPIPDMVQVGRAYPYSGTSGTYPGTSAPLMWTVRPHCAFW